MMLGVVLWALIFGGAVTVVMEPIGFWRTLACWSLNSSWMAVVLGCLMHHQVSPARTTPSRPRVSSAALLGTAGRERSRSAGGHSQK